MPFRFGPLRLPRGVPWTPDQLGSALLAWWDPSTGIVLDGGNVASWTDRKSGIVVAQATGAAQPAYSATARNGKPGLSFMGIQGLQGPSTFLPGGGASHVIAVAAYLNAATGQEYAFGYGTGAGGVRALAASASKPIFDTNGPYFQSAADWNGLDRLVSWHYAAGTHGAYVDGVADGALGSTVLATSTAASGLGIGYLPAYGALWVGVIQQVVVCNRALTTPERQKIEGWESWTDGKAGANLPAGHPYRFARPFA